MKVNVIPIIVGVLWMDPWGLGEGIGVNGNKWKNREESKRPEETCCHSDSSERPPAITGEKNYNNNN